MNSDQIKHMVERFLAWKLPENFHPDAGISFKPTFNEHSPHGPMKHNPTGTNLFDYTQAEAMIRYLLEGLPNPTTVSGEVERVARALFDRAELAILSSPHTSASRFEDHRERYMALAEAALSALRVEPPSDVASVTVPLVPTEAQWGGLARAIMMWLDMGDKVPRSLFKHLGRSGHEIPQWLRDEPEMQALDHVPSKGTRCFLIYRAMLEAALIGNEGVSDG